MRPHWGPSSPVWVMWGGVDRIIVSRMDLTQHCKAGGLRSERQRADLRAPAPVGPPAVPARCTQAGTPGLPPHAFVIGRDEGCLLSPLICSVSKKPDVAGPYRDLYSCIERSGGPGVNSTLDSNRADRGLLAFGTAN